MKKLQIILVVLTILAVAGIVAHKHKDGNFVTDPRDGKKYRTVKIGNQVWMAENLDYESANSYCYNNSADSCSKYGRLYTWAAAMDSANLFSKNGTGCGYGTNCTPAYPAQGICPDGWHLPSKSEWEDLFKVINLKFRESTDSYDEFTGGAVLLATKGWYKNSRYGVTGTDLYGFSALPAGDRTRGGLFDDVLIKTCFWSSTEYDDGNAYEAFLNFHDRASIHHGYHKYTALSVRCIKNGSNPANKESTAITTTKKTNVSSSSSLSTEKISASSQNECNQRTEEAKEIYAKCKAMKKSTDEYKECAIAYKVAKNKVTEACWNPEMTEEELKKALTQWEKQVNNCKGKQNMRCASALQQLGHYQFRLEEKLAINHKKSLDYFLEFIEKYPNHIKTPSVLFQIATIEKNNGKSKRAYSFFTRIVKEFPDNGLAPKARFYIGEYHYNNRKYRDAINAFTGIANFSTLPSKEGAFAMFHQAQSYYNIKDYPMTINTLYQYIKDIDKGQYSNDLRLDAIDLMAKSFKRMKGNSLKQAEDFFKDKNVSYKEEVYQLLQKK